MASKTNFNPYEGSEPFIFVSYCHEDNEKVYPIINALHEKGLRIWFDKGIKWGEEWPQDIAEHIIKSTMVLAFHSCNSVKSSNCRQEITYSLKNKKKLLSVYLDEVELPKGLDLQLTIYQAEMYYRYDNCDSFVNRIKDYEIFRDVKDYDFIYKKVNGWQAGPKTSSSPKTQETVVIEFRDMGGSVILRQTLQKGSMVKTPSVQPRREGYEFTGWTPNITKAEKDMVYTASYKKKAIEQTVGIKRPIERENERIEKQKVETQKTGSKPPIGNKTMVAGALICVAVLIGVLVIGKTTHKDAELSSGSETSYISAAQQSSVVEESQAEYASAEVGDSIYFGAYEQDNDTSNGKEDIEWTVLDKDGDNLLVISKYALDCQQYNTEQEDVTWENCSLREWLNGTFLKEAFSSEELKKIVNSTVTTDAGNDTEDQVFLLSIDEAEKYFDSDDARMCVPTAYVIEQGVYTSDYDSVGGEATCWWWLRSPGGSSSYAAYVPSDGSVRCLGSSVLNDSDCVRPALWINPD